MMYLASKVNHTSIPEHSPLDTPIPTSDACHSILSEESIHLSAIDTVSAIIGDTTASNFLCQTILSLLQSGTYVKHSSLSYVQQLT